MNCPYCGAVLNDDDRFCLHCGTRCQSAPQAQPEETLTAAAFAPPTAFSRPAAEETPAQGSAEIYKEKSFDWHPYGAPVKEEPLLDFRNAPASALKLPVKRSLWKMILFGILTLGIYPMVIWSRLVSEVDLVASRYDGERSMPFFAAAMLAPLTMGIHTLVWFNKLCNRIGRELQRRSIPYAFGARDFWLWAFLMSLLSGICLTICIVLASLRFDAYIVIWVLLAVAFLTLTGPFLFTAKLMKAMNLLNEDYNTNG